jgi:hypothetical protein
MKGAVQGEATATASTPVSKGIDHRVARTCGSHRRGQHRANFEHTRQVQADQREQARQDGHHDGGLQLEAPAELFTACAQAQQQGGQRHKGQHHTRGVSQAAQQERAPIVRVVRKAQHLERQHRKHTRHQVEQGTTDQRGQAVPGPGSAGWPAPGLHQALAFGIGAAAFRARGSRRCQRRPGRGHRQLHHQAGRLALGW